MSNQDALNAFVADLGTAVAAVKAEVESLEAQVAALPVETPLDFSTAQAALAALAALEPPAS